MKMYVKVYILVRGNAKMYEIDKNVYVVSLYDLLKNWQ